MSNRSAIHVGVKRGIVLQQILPAASTVTISEEPFTFKRDAEGHRNDRSDINVLGVGGKTLARDREVIGIEWNIGNGEFSGTVGGGGPLKTADRIANFYVRVGNHCTGRIHNGACDRCRTSARLRVRLKTQSQKRKP